MADPAPAVLIAGAGPVGLTTAHELARRGVPVRLVDAAPGPATSSRALAVHARTMEVLEQMGALDRLLPLGRRVTHFTMHRRGRTLIRFDTNYRSLPTRYPFSLMVDQVVTEQVLRERTAELGVPVEWGVELTALQTGPDSVLVTLRHADGRTEETRVPWLVGADGGRSTVRKQLGMRLIGDSTEVWLNADVTLDADLPPDSNHLLHTEPGTLLLVPFPEPGKWRVVDTVDTDGAEDRELVRRRLADKIGRALGRPVQVGTPTWLSVFTVQQRQITRMREGRCFLAGDAAHVHSPASGQGMNSGIQDAYNLAWKLADVIRGTDVQLILCGHFHLQILARLEQATVWVTPGVVSRIDLTARPGTERAVHGPSASLVHLGAPHGPLIHTLHARDPRMGETVYEADEEEMREVIERLGPRNELDPSLGVQPFGQPRV